jgi:hyperosmotically inducible protein
MIHKKLIIIIVLSLFLLAFSACESKGPAEKAGEKIDQAVEKTSDKVNEATEAVKDKAEEVGKAVKTATQ